MNKQIKQLAEQAGLEFDDDLALEPEPIYYTTQKDLEKFAQLIVRECASIVDNYGRWILYDKLAVKVKKHFGVEE